MDRNGLVSLRPASCRRGGRYLLGLVGPLACLVLPILGGCARPTLPAVNTAALAQQAYASNGTIRSVSDALDRRLDVMVAAQTAEMRP